MPAARSETGVLQQHLLPRIVILVVSLAVHGVRGTVVHVRVAAVLDRPGFACFQQFLLGLLDAFVGKFDPGQHEGVPDVYIEAVVRDNQFLAVAGILDVCDDLEFAVERVLFGVPGIRVLEFAAELDIEGPAAQRAAGDDRLQCLAFD